MKNKVKAKLSQLVGVIALAAVSLSSIYGLFLLSEGDSVIKITDHDEKDEEIVTPPGSIFVDPNKSPDITKEELDAIVSALADKSVVNVSDAARLPDKFTSITGAGVLSQKGYYTSDESYDSEKFIIGKWTPDFELPQSFSLRSRKEQTVEYKQAHDYAEFSVVYTETETARPAIEVYMGYLFVDNGTSLSVYSTPGKYLTSFDDTKYVPAFTRDSEGNPLFYKMATVESGYFDGEGVDRLENGSKVKEPHEKDKTVLVQGELTNEGKGDPVKEEVKEFYYLNGSRFVKAKYNDALENRGLYFNYPSYYGIGDSDIILQGETYDEYKKDIDGKITVTHKIDWLYERWDAKLNEYKYLNAYNFTEGFGCVLLEPYYNDGGLFFLDESGARAFYTLKKYKDEKGDRYVIDNYMPPISNGPESIGYFYFDHGLVRVRLETIDYYNYDSNNLKHVYSSEEILINKRGDRFDIPVGYEVKGYSEGMILLEKDGLYGFMDYTGDWIAEPIYVYAEAFSEGLAPLKTPDGRWGMIDTKGNIVLPFAYDYISSSSDGLIACYSGENGWEIMRKMTK